MQLGNDAEDAQLESRSMVSEGGLTHITQFTNCTNPTFDAVHREWRYANFRWQFFRFKK